MPFEFEIDADYPQLGWVCRHHPGREATRVVHGGKVETRPHFFVEGVWDGEFSDGAFDLTDAFFGSGGLLRDDSLTLVPSGSTADQIYHTRDRDGSTVASNSLALLLAALGLRLDPQCSKYDAINDSLLSGIEDYVREIPVLGGSVRRLMYHNLRIGLDGAVTESKPMPKAIHSYRDYRDYLGATYASLANNAHSADRAEPLSIYSTQSRGYDTTAVNALAAEHGVKAAFTVTRSKGRGRFAWGDESFQGVDDGTEICQRLAIPVIRVNRRAFAKGHPRELLFHAGVDRCPDLNMLEIFELSEPPGVLLTGMGGEIWYHEKWFREHDRPLDDTLARSDRGNTGMREARLYYGLVHAPIPFLGARRLKDLVRITHSPEMDEWRLGTDYDRPIPRRIAEETGVPRELFGQEKMASVVRFPEPNVPYNAELRSEYFDWLAEHELLSRASLRLMPLVHRWNQAVHFRKGPPRHTFLYYLERAVSRLIGRGWEWKKLWTHLHGRLYCFSVNRLADEYA